ncbi:hypothetical protein Misp01_19070 [Microtetraspora sp. NBRC 13810]|nr:hypothetical protein Misp01_19070 [Microtetraspora sp. NBRC 13810]
MSLGISLLAPVSPAQAAPAHKSGKQYHLDCGSGNDAASGTSPSTAWRTIDRVNTVTFQPGDSILLRRGTTCDGVLQPKGSGTAGEPITLGAYGQGARPAIVGGGARATVFLRNVQGWVIRDLDVSNPGPADGTPRVGIYVLLENYGIGRNYVVRDVNVHDVPGCDCLQPELENSGGILFKAAGSETATGFTGIKVFGNTVSGVDNTGIGAVSQWSHRLPLYPAGTNTYVPIRDVHIHDNRLTDMGGDGILVQNGVDPVVERNFVDGFGVRATQSHAAIVAFNSDRAVIQHNEVTGGAANPPSFSFSVDAANSDIVYQYNYSHDNDGPFMLMCAFTGTYSDGATIRYNISENDKDLLLGGTFEIPVIANGCEIPIPDVKIYNNVIYSPAAKALVGTLHQTPMAVRNNIFAGRPEGSTIDDPVSVYEGNLYHNLASVPAGDTRAVTGDPRFTDPAATGPRPTQGFRLACGSPALGAGVSVPRDGGVDFYGFRIPFWSPSIGAYQGPCVRP